MLNVGDRVRLVAEIDPKDGINPVLPAGTKGVVTAVYPASMDSYPYDVDLQGYKTRLYKGWFPLAAREIELDPDA